MWCLTCEEGTEHFFRGGAGGDAVCCSGHEQASDLAGRPGFVKSKITFGSFEEARPPRTSAGRQNPWPARQCFPSPYPPQVGRAEGTSTTSLD